MAHMNAWIRYNMDSHDWVGCKVRGRVTAKRITSTKRGDTFTYDRATGRPVGWNPTVRIRGISAYKLDGQSDWTEITTR